MSRDSAPKPPKDVQHKAIDTSGILGSLYDGRRNRILKRTRVKTRKDSFLLLDSIYCMVEKGNADGPFNVLKFIGIQDELRLNLLLDITKRVGIASVMNYSYRINEYTRFLYYSSPSGKEQLTCTAEEVEKWIILSDPQFKATHIINSIDIGIDVLVVLQIPSDVEIASQIDNILQKIRHTLLNTNAQALAWTSEETCALEQIIHVTIYSNTPSLIDITNLPDLFYQIDQIKKSSYDCYPITYYLRPTKWFNNQYASNDAILKVIPPEISHYLEQYLLQMRTSLKYMDAFLSEDTAYVLFGDLPDRIYNARQEWSTLKDNYKMLTERFSKLVTTVRSGRYDASIIYQELRRNVLQNSVNQLLEHMYDLEKEAKMTADCPQQQFNDKTVNTGVQHDQTPSTNSALNDNHQSSELCENKSQLSSVSVTDSKSLSHQKNSIVLLLNNINDNETEAKDKMFSPKEFEQSPVLSDPPSPKHEMVINIVLIGETGVGKSTFINAFVNYLTFDTLSQAQLNKPVVLIPILFSMIIGDDFKEHIVKFGDFDGYNNEDFNHPGQSVTQHCKSYIFHLNDGNKLCIIDTPGFGDTRGFDQDDQNIQHTLEYINNLTHIDAICVLFKPNAKTLTICFRSCLTQLINFLGPNIYKNLTFCFTNARSSFYTPGSTASLLRNFFESISTNEILLQKYNTFCFDSESFRYLAALKNDIQFHEEEKSEYEKSWSNSVKESKRLIGYIREKLVVHRIQGKIQSIKHAQFEIIHMIRPMIETIRNIFRNIILLTSETLKKSIELCPTIIHRPATLCISCNSQIIQIGKFWIAKDYPHEFKDTCFMCSCSLDKHFQIDYLLDYKLVNGPSKHPDVEMHEYLSILCYASTLFADFLMHIATCTKDDPFLDSLMRMIEEEKKICDKFKSNPFNTQLVKELKELKQTYEKQSKKMILNQNPNNLTLIYEWIEKVKNISLIQQQLVIIKIGQEIMMKQHELNSTDI